MARGWNYDAKPMIPDLSPQVLDQMVDTYRRIRIAVYTEAIKGPSPDVIQHAESQQAFRAFVTGLCADANLRTYADTSPESRQRLWRHIWTKIRYAGIRAEGASKEIEDTSDLFDDAKSFCDKNWDTLFDKKKKETKNGARNVNEPNILLCGPYARQYFEKSGIFAGKYYYRNVSKLMRTINIAKALTDFSRKNPNAPTIEFLSGGISSKNVWPVFRRITAEQGYLSDITALHLMMDLGYEVMKPDRVMARAFFQLGWLGQIVDLPAGITEADIIPTSSGDDPEEIDDEERPGGRYHYIHPTIARPIVDLSRQIAARVSKEDLESDIGWCTDNKLREFDIFMVKYGQQPEPKLGLHRNLSADAPYHAFRDPAVVG